MGTKQGHYKCYMCSIDVLATDWNAHDGMCIPCWKSDQELHGAKKVDAMGFASYRKSAGNVSQQSPKVV